MQQYTTFCDVVCHSHKHHSTGRFNSTVHAHNARCFVRMPLYYLVLVGFLTNLSGWRWIQATGVYTRVTDPFSRRTIIYCGGKLSGPRAAWVRVPADIVRLPRYRRVFDVLLAVLVDSTRIVCARSVAACRLYRQHTHTGPTNWSIVLPTAELFCSHSSTCTDHLASRNFRVWRSAWLCVTIDWNTHPVPVRAQKLLLVAVYGDRICPIYFNCSAV